MKKILILIFTLFGYFSKAQNFVEIIQTDEKRTPINLEKLLAYDVHKIDSLPIYNHSGSYRSTLRNLKGPLLKDVLKDYSFGEESSKVLSEYYIVCTAVDGYKTVISYNELFNNILGDKILLITNLTEATNGKEENKIALVSASDIATGRRFIKQLQTIKLVRAN